MNHIAFVSGHLDLTEEEFREHYEPAIRAAAEQGHMFVVGDARGADDMAQQLIRKLCVTATVYHMFREPRFNAGFHTMGGYQNDEERDRAMTAASDYDIAWVRAGREQSCTAKNLRRRQG